MHRRVATQLAAATLGLLAVPLAAAQSQAIQPHVTELDGYTFRASAISSTSLPPQMTEKYGIDRSASVGVLNVVVMRRGNEVGGPNVPAEISASVEDAARRPQDIDMRAAVANRQISYIGTFVVYRPGEIHDFTVRLRPGDSRETFTVRFRDYVGLPR